MSFKGKVVLITGAGSGIGANCAETFAHNGALLSLIDKNKHGVEIVADKCEKISSLKPLVIVADVTKDAKKIIDDTTKFYGQLNILINNAGIMAARVEPMEPSSLAVFDKTMNTNIRAVYELTMYAIPHLIATKGNIVNLSSVASVRQFPTALSYCVSKAAVDQFTKCLALELAPNGVRVNSVNPSVIITNIHLSAGFTEEQYATYKEKCTKTHPLQRPGQPQEVSNAILFLAGDGASFITGTSLLVCGGRSIL